MKAFFKCALLSLFAFALFSESAQAIPAFARKYRLSCTTCHYPFPRLKAYGDDFAAAGFQLEDEDAPGYFIDTGDNNLNLLRNLPIAMRVDAWAYVASTGENDDEEYRLDFRTPWVMKFLSGGALSDHVAYYFYFYFDEHGEVAGIDDAFIMFNDILPNQDFDVYVGQYAVSDPMMKSELRLTYENYEAYRALVGQSRIRLYYDRGIMATWGDLWSGSGVTLQVFNGNGIGEYEDGFASADKNPVFAGHIAQDIGEVLNVGVFGLYGNETMQISPPDTRPYDGDNSVTYLGVNGTIEIPKLQLNAQYLDREDTNPFFAYEEAEFSTQMDGIIAELIYWPRGDRSKFYGALLYNYINLGTDENLADELTLNRLDERDYQTVTAHIGHMALTNVRIGLEGTYDLERENFRGGIGIMAAW